MLALATSRRVLRNDEQHAEQPETLPRPAKSTILIADIVDFR
jgi:hypothetical protein